MAGSLQSRVKTWISTEDVVFSDLNAEFDNLLLAMQPLLIDDYSTNAAQMQVTTDPGEVGTESLATTLAGELARLRHMLKEISGEEKWYESPIASLAGLANALGTGLTDNRLVSGRVRSGSQQPMFLVPNGAARTVKLDGSPVSFIYYIEGVEYTIDADVTITNLTAAPSSNNTCLINDANAADQEFTKFAGENGTEIPIDTAGTEITALVGKYAAFKIGGTTDEYFIAKVKSSTSLVDARRGYFFDSTDAPIPRAGYTNNDTITLMKLTWVFAKSDETLTVTYNNPIWSDDEPSSPSIGDYWFDYSANKWKKYDVASYIDADAMLVGVCIQDTTNTVGARSYEFFGNYDSLNTVELIAESNSQVKSRLAGSQVNVWGEVILNDHNLHTWDMTLDLDSGITEAASTYYFFYLTETGDKIISNIRPYDRGEDLRGWYHPHQSWRCVGFAFNDGSSNLSNIESFYRKYPATQILPTQTASMNLEASPVVIPLDASGGAFTDYVADCAYWRGRRMLFMKTDTSANAITLDGFGAQLLGPAVTYKLERQYDFVEFLSDGLNAHIVNRRKRHLWQAKTLSADVGASATVTDLGFANLEVGKSYRITFQASMDINASDHGRLSAVHNSVTLGLVEFDGDTAISTNNYCAGSSSVFTATATTLTFDWVRVAASTLLLGNATREETFAVLEELPDSLEVSTW